MKALILTGDSRVCQVENDEDVFPVHSSLQWIDCSDSVTSKHTYVDGQFVDPVEWSDEYQWKEIRNRRDALLAQSDWTQNSDVPADVDAWKTYRQALRDMPGNVSDPGPVFRSLGDGAHAAWPTKPE